MNIGEDDSKGMGWYALGIAVFVVAVYMVGLL